MNINSCRLLALSSLIRASECKVKLTRGKGLGEAFMMARLRRPLFRFQATISFQNFSTKFYFSVTKSGKEDIMLCYFPWQPGTKNS